MSANWPRSDPMTVALKVHMPICGVVSPSFLQAEPAREEPAVEPGMVFS